MATTQNQQDTIAPTTRIVDHHNGRERAWVNEAVRLPHADATRSADTHVFEASSGSTAVSEAYFAQLLGLKFTAVVPRSTSREKVEPIKPYGGEAKDPGADGDTEKAAARKS